MQYPTVFIVSDGTGITAETFANSILSQFDFKFHLIRMPFINTKNKAIYSLNKINNINFHNNIPTIVFSTLVNQELNKIIKNSNTLVLDIFQTFIKPLEIKLKIKSSHAMGRGHQNINTEKYKNRIEAINFALSHDDGQSIHLFGEADVILIGVSRSGKTPTSLYLAMQYGIKAANYPLVLEDFNILKLPKCLIKYYPKIFGLSIDPNRLSEIRNERYPYSKYATIENCIYEVHKAELLMKKSKIKWILSTNKSIEEIATTILQDILI